MDLDSAEDHTASLTDRTTAAHDDRAVHLLDTADADGEIAETRGPAPNVVERRDGEVATPEERDPDAAQQGQQLVAETFTALEARVGALPHAVHGVGAIRLGEDILEAHLKPEHVQPVKTCTDLSFCPNHTMY